MARDSSDNIRRDALAKGERIERALAALEALTLDEAEYVYAKLDKRLHAAQPDSSKGSAQVEVAKRGVPHDAKAPLTRDQTPTPPHPRKGTKLPPVNGRFTTRAEKLIAENPQGLRSYEIADAIGQDRENIRSTLKKLAAKNRIVCHGDRIRAQWTLPGVTPMPRIANIDDAIFAVLGAGPVGHSSLVDGTMKVFEAETHKPIVRSSVNTRLSRLLTSKAIVQNGADERGAIYALPPEANDKNADDDDDEEGGDGSARVIN